MAFAVGFVRVTAGIIRVLVIKATARRMAMAVGTVAMQSCRGVPVAQDRDRRATLG